VTEQPKVRRIGYADDGSQVAETWCERCLLDFDGSLWCNCGKAVPKGVESKSLPVSP